jgi:membrane protein implicated in regulation of membrane protease activity
MNQRTRKLLGMFTLLLGLLAYIVVVITIATTWLPSHWAIQLLFFAVAGVAWAIPLKPFMAWMNQAAEE